MKKKTPSFHRTASYQAHRRGLIWQILIPIVIALLFVIATSVLVATGENETASLWADISMIWLLIPLLFFSSIFLIILAGIIYGMAMLLKATPIYTQKLYKLIRLLTQKIETVADEIAKPIFFVEGISASIKRFFQQK
jgi:hypothetical protein